VSLVALAAIYVVVIALGSTHAWSGSDAGGKVATIRWMSQHHSLKPDVGYWAAPFDPSGTHHPLIYTQRHGDQWVQVTSFPFVYAGLPLYKAAGTAGILLLPIVGSLLAAYAARRLARALGAPTGWWAFWLVGVGTPMLFYAGDFWEHSMGVGLMLFAIALALEGGVARAFAAGALAGLAGVLRTETLLYAGFVGIALLLIGGEWQAWLRRPARIVALGAGLGAVLVANGAVERAVLGSGLRDTRAGSNVAAAGSTVGTRLHDGLLTAIGLFGDDTTKAYVGGAVVVIALLVFTWAIFRGRERSPLAVVSGATAVAMYIARFASTGLVLFVPGVFPAAPVSAAGITGATTRRQIAIAGAAVVVLPAVWLLQWRGQLLPQWGGRYVLLTGALLTVVGAVAIERRGRTQGVVVLLAITLVVAVFSAAWHIQRTRGVAQAVASIERAPRDAVVVSRLAHLGREGGAWYGRHRWLNADGDAGTADAASIATRSGASHLDVVDLDQGQQPQALDGWTVSGRRLVPYLGFHLVDTSYTRR
jgi:hypothetical protein